MKGVLYALLAALLFGVSTPLAKLLLPQVAPMMMAGLLYLGSGIGLATFYLIRSHTEGMRSQEALLTRADWPWLASAIATGGVAAPVLLMWGLAVTPASSASLLLNLEGVLTALLAWFAFKENFDKRIAIGMSLISLGGFALSWTGHSEGGFPWGSAAIVTACLAWAIDNNFTRKISGGDPVQIAMLKGLVAGAMNTGLALSLGARFPSFPQALTTGIVGLLGYGVSLTLFVLALRYLGTARTGAYFSIAPFVGAAVSVLLLDDRVTIGFGIAAVLMALGVWLHLTEHHEHEHRHELMEHEHLHTHDDHHQHEHKIGDPVGEPHSHWHRHEPLVHSHPHYPDIHHRHDHHRQP